MATQRRLGRDVMKVSEIIELLSKMYDPNDSVVIAWWDQDSFSEASDMDEDEWTKATEYMDEMDWSRTKDGLTDVLRYFVSDYVKEDNA